MASSIDISRVAWSRVSFFVPTTTFKQSSLAESSKGRNLALQ